MAIWRSNKEQQESGADPTSTTSDQEAFLLSERLEAFLQLEKINAAAPDPDLVETAIHSRCDGLEDFIRIGIDSCFCIAEQKFFLSGWIIDEGDFLAGLNFRHGTKFSDDIRADAHQYYRADLNKAFSKHLSDGSTAKFGISTVIDLDVRNSGLSEHALSLVGHTQRGEFFQLQVPEVLLDHSLVDMSSKLFGEFNLSSSGSYGRLNAVGEALQSSVQLGGRAVQSIGSRATEEIYGEPVAEPLVSVVVPLYGRFDFMEYQLSQFAMDPDFQQCDLIYVIDDPRIIEPVRRTCDDLYGIYRVPFRIVFSGENQGFAAANNVGVHFSRAEKVLLMNSDVMPKKSGWLLELCETYETLPDAAAIAPLLTFEDGSVQHCGISFEVHPDFPELWVNTHPFKGLPVSLLGLGEEPQVVPAVTAACMLISRKRYDELGGLDEQYVLGDFEDSDLCLKGLAEGYRNYLIPGVSLYHLERMSQNLFEDIDWKKRITLFNCWQHSARWGDAILKITSEDEKAGGVSK